IHHGYEGRTLVDDFSTLIMRGDRIGIIGPNGVGKTTLINILLGELKPDQGDVKLGTKLEIAYFDQHRAQLDEKQSAMDNVSGGKDLMTINGQPRHVISYLQDFLFTPERARAPITALSGGERNRLLLAKIMAKPSNLLILDEPTNDLDIETLELLEEMLDNYPGTLMLVSHDRDFLNNVVTSTIAFEGHGTVKEYVGGYDDWLRQKPTDAGGTSNAKLAQEKQKDSEPKTKASNKGQKKLKKLSYKDQLELDKLPELLAELEGKIEAVHKQMSDPEFYQKDGDTIADTKQALEQLEAELEQKFERWEALEAMRNSL
ncbi:MAG: ATP-binding cassette domain-containing protein, partial [Kangiella sp.]|nr:ATP-binding cassette domain-containing protein [Kangiella sp.]